jgi:hypothetical protein
LLFGYWLEANTPQGSERNGASHDESEEGSCTKATKMEGWGESENKEQKMCKI